MSTPKENESMLDYAIEHALGNLVNHDAASEEYGTVLERLVRLQKLKDTERQSSRVSPDTIVMAGANLLGIAMIIRHEHINVITSKATGFVTKLR